MHPLNEGIYTLKHTNIKAPKHLRYIYIYTYIYIYIYSLTKGYMGLFGFPSKSIRPRRDDGVLRPRI